MNAKDAIRYAIEGGHMITTAYVADLDDADLMVRPVPGANHIAWQLGHMIAGTPHMLAAVGLPAPALPGGFTEAHSNDTADCDDPKKFRSKQEYLKLLGEMKAASLAAVDATPDETLDQHSPESMREYAPTVGTVLMVLGTHLLMHAGQFVPVRRKLGKKAMF